MKKYRLRNVVVLVLVVLCCSLIPQAAMADDSGTPNAFAGATVSGSASYTSSWGVVWYFLGLP